jgi:UDP-N-acetylmuramate--alanine ligase
VEVGHDARHLPANATVVVSTAIRETNPELVAARERGCRSCTGPGARRADGRAPRRRRGGHARQDLDHVDAHRRAAALRARPVLRHRWRPDHDGAGAHHGAGDVFVVEADESDGSFTAFTPDVAVVTNVEPDHLDHHGTEEAYRAVFAQFVDRIRPGGTLIACTDDPGVVPLVARPATGGSPSAATGTPSRPTPCCSSSSRPARAPGYGPRLGGDEVVLRLAVPGEHMALNALGAALAAVEMGAHRDCLTEGLAAFDGVRRRFEYRAGRAVWPCTTTTRTTPPRSRPRCGRRGRSPRAAGRRRLPTAPLHRTRTFAGAFGAALSLADEVVVLDVYGAREDPEPGVTGALVANAVPLPPERVHYVPRWAEVPAVLAGLARPGDLVLTMGAGDVTVLGPEVLRELDRAARPERSHP